MCEPELGPGTENGHYEETGEIQIVHSLNILFQS